MHRDVDPEVRQVANVALSDMDELQELAQHHRQAREAEVVKAE